MWGNSQEYVKVSKFDYLGWANFLKSHLQINKKKPGGSGWGYSKEKQLEESIKLLLENENKLMAKMCSDLKEMVSLREKQLEDAIHLLVENEKNLLKKCVVVWSKWFFSEKNCYQKR